VRKIRIGESLAMEGERTVVVSEDKQREFLCGLVRRRPLPFQAVVGPVVRQRTLTQNGRLWLLHTAASQVSGYTPEECHEEMLCAHYGYTEQQRISPWTGEIEMKKTPNKRSSTRNRKEFAEFMDFCENFYGEKLGVWLE
jgi:hypothetical protein